MSHESAPKSWARSTGLTLALFKHTRKAPTGLMDSFVCGFLSIVSMMVIDTFRGLRGSDSFSGMHSPQSEPRAVSPTRRFEATRGTVHHYFTA